MARRKQPVVIHFRPREGGTKCEACGTAWEVIGANRPQDGYTADRKYHALLPVAGIGVGQVRCGETPPPPPGEEALDLIRRLHDCEKVIEDTNAQILKASSAVAELEKTLETAKQEVRMHQHTLRDARIEMESIRNRMKELADTQN